MDGEGTMKELRTYQKDSINALWGCWNKNSTASPLIVAPTGAGKSLIIASIIKQVSANRPQFRFLVVTHTKEIVRQNAEELWGLIEEPVGVYSAGLNSKQIKRVTFANVQSIYKKCELLSVDMLIIDEAHLVPKKEDTMYQRMIASLKAFNPTMRILGVTATPFRLDQGNLVSTGSVFSEVAYDIGIKRLIEEGYLAPIVSIMEKSVDLTEVKLSGYDYNQTDLQRAFGHKELIANQCCDIVHHGGNRKSWLIFCTGVDHAKEVSEELNRHGITSTDLNGDHTDWDREEKIKGFKDGKYRAICNVGVLTTGFNYPGVDMVVLLRATKSAALYIQAVGRGTRMCDGKRNCLLLDFGGNIDRHGPIDLITVRRDRGGSDRAAVTSEPFKRCPVCACACGIGTLHCPNCEYAFPDRTIELERKASTSKPLSEPIPPPEPETYVVREVTVGRHQKGDSPDSFRVDYHVGFGNFKVSEWLCFEHGGFATVQGARKWAARGGQSPYPQTVSEALSRWELEVEPVGSITAVKKGKFFEVLAIYPPDSVDIPPSYEPTIEEMADVENYGNF